MRPHGLGEVGRDTESGPAVEDTVWTQGAPGERGPVAHDEVGLHEGPPQVHYRSPHSPPSTKRYTSNHMNDLSSNTLIIPAQGRFFIFVFCLYFLYLYRCRIRWRDYIIRRLCACVTPTVDLIKEPAIPVLTLTIQYYLRVKYGK